MIVHFHGAWALEGAYEGAGKVSVAVKHALERVVYSRGSRFIVLSEASGAILEHEYGVPHEAVRVIPGGVEMHKFRDTLSRSEAREVLGWPADRPTIVTVRRLARTKGLGNLIDAIDAVRRAVPDVLLMIAGTGPLEHELAEQVRDLGLARWVRFIGHVGADLPTVYRAADISVVPSLALEGFGLVVIESLACGTPALVTPVTGLPEVVADLDPALVFPSVDKTDIARGLIDALTGRVPLPSSANCVVHAERFDWPVIAQRIAAVYLEAAQQAS
jgi:glycogen(starch) synthase